MPRPPKKRSKPVKRIVTRYLITRVDSDFWAKAYDQSNERFPEADYLHTNRERVCRVARKRVNQSYSPKKEK